MENEMEKRIRNLFDKELYKMILHPNDYIPEALEVAKDEIEKRGGLTIIEEKVQPEIEIEEKEQAKDLFNWSLAISFLPSAIIMAILFLMIDAALNPILENIKSDFIVHLIAFSLVPVFGILWVFVARIFENFLPRNK